MFFLIKKKRPWWQLLRKKFRVRIEQTMTLAMNNIINRGLLLTYWNAEKAKTKERGKRLAGESGDDKHAIKGSFFAVSLHSILPELWSESLPKLPAVGGGLMTIRTQIAFKVWSRANRRSSVPKSASDQKWVCKPLTHGQIPWRVSILLPSNFSRSCNIQLATQGVFFCIYRWNTDYIKAIAIERSRKSL